MKHYYSEFTKFCIGKTISKIEDNSVNCMVIHFTDGSSVELFVECGTGAFSVPFFDPVTYNDPKTLVEK